MMIDRDAPMYVAVFRDHPLGLRRFTKDFKHNLSEYNAPWWTKGTEEQRVEHFAWALNHNQYHYSTDDIRRADLWYQDGRDAYDLAILEKYAPVEFLEVVFAHSEKDAEGWQTYWVEEKGVSQ